MKFRVSVMAALEVSREYLMIKCDTLEEVLAAKEAMALLLLHLQDKLAVMKDYSNMFVVEIFEDGEWVEFDELEHGAEE